jgi:hypothetical protein
MLHDGAAEVDHEARRLAGLILVRERGRVVAHRETDRLPLFYIVERSSGGRTERQCGGRQGHRDESKKTDNGSHVIPPRHVRSRIGRRP